MKLAVAALVCALATAAYADDAEQALRDAQQRAAAGDPTAIDALEAVGSARPITRWTDDAWRTAAQLAERANDFARARRDLEQVVATSDDEQAVRRARADLDRIATQAGAAGEWSEVAAAHERLVQRARAGGDPAPALRDLEALVRANPRYPRAAMVMLAIAQGWERDGDPERAIRWLRDAVAAAGPADRTRATAELARTLIRHGELAAARDTITAISDPMLAAELHDRLATAELRRAIHWGVVGVLVAIAAIALVALRRAAGSWRRVPRRLARPPIEAVFFAPIAAVFALVAKTGNPLVARAVIAIAIAGTAVSWISGAILDGRRERPRVRMLVLHVALAALAVLAAIYLAIDRDRMIDLIIETWRGGPAMR
jgi:predicted negative regulator of RcsB-dependent stress response